MSINRTIITFLLILSNFFSFSQVNEKKYNFEIQYIPFQKSIVNQEKFTQTLNNEFASFDFKITRSTYRFLISSNIKKWSFGLGTAIATTKADWILGFNKKTNNVKNTLHTFVNHSTLNLDLITGYKVFKNTNLTIIISPNFKFFSKSNQHNTNNTGTIIFGDGSTVDYTELKTNPGSFFSVDLQAETQLTKSFSLLYGINFTRYWSMYLYNMVGRPPSFQPDESIIELNIKGFIPYLQMGVGYKINKK